MKEYTKPTVTHVPLGMSPVLGGENSQACKSAAVGSGSQAAVNAGGCGITCYIPVITGGGS
jgi:hypothetical protein